MTLRPALGDADTLHVTNGDSTVPLLRAAGATGALLPWRDALHAGPVPAIGDDELVAVRAAFLGAVDGTAADAVAATLRSRDRRFTEQVAAGESVLWFEHDLYDQLQLLQILAREPAAATDRVLLICVASVPGRPRFHGLGELEPAELRALWPAGAPVSTEAVALACRAWAAFRAPTPQPLAALLDDDLDALPFLHQALDRLLDELPAVGSGLSRTEATLLRELADGSRTALDLFEALQASEAAPYQADTFVWRTLDELAALPAPLVRRTGDGGFELTTDGERVLAGRADAIALRPIDRWLGGTHLTSAAAWRRDGAGALVRP